MEKLKTKNEIYEIDHEMAVEFSVQKFATGVAFLISYYDDEHPHRFIAIPVTKEVAQQLAMQLIRMTD